MKIDSSNLSLESQYSHEFSHTSSTSVQIHHGQVNQNENPEENGINSAVTISFSASISIESSTRVAYDYENDMSPQDRLKKKIIEKLLDRFYGKDLKEDFHPNKNRPHYENSNILNPYEEKTSTVQSSNIVTAFVFETQESYYQKQTIDFSANLEINTPSKSFELDLSISFSKELYESHSSRLVIGDERVIDPLVVNFDDDINPFDNISSLKFEFDLNSDGTLEWIPLLKSGAGYLSLDKNGNEKIDDGSELFGTKTGDGFKELSDYDEDNNNWIDENDSIFNQLKIWQKDDENEARLVSLVDLNIGALYLGDVQSGYKYQSSISNTEAIQKSNSVFIKEDASSLGIINSIDILV